MRFSIPRYKTVNQLKFTPTTFFFSLFFTSRIVVSTLFSIPHSFISNDVRESIFVCHSCSSRHAVCFSGANHSAVPGSAFTPRFVRYSVLPLWGQSFITHTAGSNAQKCLRADNKDGAPVVLTSCTGGADQEWSWKNGAVTLHNGSKCLAVVNNQDTNGAKLKVANCGGDSQQFEYTPWGENQCVLLSFILLNPMLMMW